MKITKRQLRRIIRESLTRSYPSDPRHAFHDHPDYKAGTQDAKRGVSLPEDSSDEYQAGYYAAMQEW